MCDGFDVKMSEVKKGDFITAYKIRGKNKWVSCVLKQAGRWCIDVDIPIFKEDNRKYIDSLLVVQDKKE